MVILNILLKRKSSTDNKDDGNYNNDDIQSYYFGQFFVYASIFSSLQVFSSPFAGDLQQRMHSIISASHPQVRIHNLTHVLDTTPAITNK